MLFDNPQPFLFDAADINSDNDINVLDIIGVVDILMNENGNRDENDLIPTYASFSIIDNTIHLETDGQIAGYQLCHVMYPII